MALGLAEMEILIASAQQKLSEELILANHLGTLDDVLSKYGLKKSSPRYFSEVARHPKVLVCGDLGIKQKDLSGLIKNMSLNPDQFEFVAYDDVTNYNFSKLEYNSSYSDILFGPAPHQAKGADGYRSIINCIESQPEIYPKMLRIETFSGELKISKTSFSSALKRTQYFELEHNRFH